jgi:fatty-acyl-CoA synthase
MGLKAYDWVAHHAMRTPHKIAQIDLHTGRRFTYAEMNERVGRLAHHLAAELGILRGDRVAILAPNSTDYMEVQFACGRMGAVFLPLNWRLAVPELEFIVGDADPKALIYDDEFADAAQALQRACAIPALLTLDGSGGDNDYEAAIAGAAGAAPPQAAEHDDLHTILYTSGTTGHPKGAMITHGMLFWNAVNLGLPHLITPETVQLSILPLFHTGGLNCYCNAVIHAGGTIAIMRAFEPGETIAALRDPAYGFTHFFGVPAPYLFMSQHPDFENADFSHLKVCGIGGAPSPLSLLEAWAAKGIALQQGFGMTETSPAVLALDADKAVEKAGSAGQPVLHTEVKLVAEDGAEISEPEAVGELWVKGPNITPGYWNRPEESAEAIVDGWLKTGDAAKFDAEGFYYIVDRWKDMYISGGENVYPAEVENAIYELPGIAEVAVIGVPDERWGEVGEAIVVVKTGHNVTESSILDHCQGRLARYKQPKSVRFIEALPRNATGKVLKRELRG